MNWTLNVIPMSNNIPISAGEIAVESTTIEKHIDLIEPRYPIPYNSTHRVLTTIDAAPVDTPIKIINIGAKYVLSVLAIKSSPKANGNKKNRNKWIVLNRSTIQPEKKVAPTTLNAKKG